jgi:hypothetical protein
MHCGQWKASGKASIGARLVLLVRCISLTIYDLEEEVLLWEIVIFPSHRCGGDSCIAGDF